MVNYKVIIKNSAGDLTEFEKFSSLSYERYENEVGVCRFLLPYSDTKLTATNVEVGRGEIRIYRESSLVWQGFISVIENKLEGAVIYGFDFMETLKWYRVGYNIDYINKKIGSEIVAPTWSLIAAKTNPFLGSVVLNGEFQDPYQVGTSTPKTITRTVMDEDFFSFLQEMVALSRADSPSGAWKQDTVFGISLSETAPHLTFMRDVGSDKPEVVLQLDSEIANFLILEDATNIRNDVKGVTVTENPEVLTSTQVDATSRTSFYLREISNLFPLADAQTSLDEHTKDFLKENKDIKIQSAFEFSSGLVPLDGYGMGDSVKVILNRGRVAIDEFYRVVGMRVGYESGVELTVPVLRKKRS